MQTLALIVLLSAAFFYLGSRAKITGWLWSRYPPNFAAFMDCAACTGFWYGLAISVVLDVHYGFALPFGLPSLELLSHVALGLLSLVLTPIAAGIMQWGLDTLGVAVPTQDDSPPNE